LKEVASSRVALEAAEKSIMDAKADEAKLLDELKDITARFDDAKAMMKELEDELKKCSSELKALSDEKTDLEKNKEVMKLDMKKSAIQVAKYEKDRSSAERGIASMLQKHVWIETEKEVFGVPGSDYDFEKADPVAMSVKLKSLKDEQSTLVRKKS
jgi:structural maintenance of chromosome 2